LGERKRLPEHYVDTLSLVTGTESLELETGDTLLLCSDGLWEPVDEQAMAQTLAEHAADVQAAAEALIASALEHGGPDNATVSLLRIEESPRAFAKV
jgi:protein phosphatase